MKIVVSDSKIELGAKAAREGGKIINKCIELQGEANIIVATGASQFEMLSELVKLEIDWSRVNAFHLDEYIGITEEHPASFRKYLKERFVEKVPIKEFHYVNPGNDPIEECAQLGKAISKHPIDVAFVGIGENAHLAFNDPPADFNSKEAYIVVDLDEACRKQQMNEGWFKTMEEVPLQAISMTVHQILKSETIICSVPDERKAEAVKNSVEGAITPSVPSSILQKHENCYVFLDNRSAKLLDKKN